MMVAAFICRSFCKINGEVNDEIWRYLALNPQPVQKGEMNRLSLVIVFISTTECGLKKRGRNLCTYLRNNWLWGGGGVNRGKRVTDSEGGNEQSK